MHFNLLAISAAVIASYVLGSLWYLLLGKSWRAALGWREDGPPYRPTPFELFVGFAGQLAMAAGLYAGLTQLGAHAIPVSLAVAFGIWAAFILPSLATNVVFQRRNNILIWQDGLHWLLILTVQAGMIALLA